VKIGEAWENDQEVLLWS